MRICFITEGYPTKDNPWFSFVDQLVCAIADYGIECCVIAPQSFTKSIIKGKPLRKKEWIRKTQNKNEIKIYQPYYLSYGNRFSQQNYSNFSKACEKLQRKKGIEVDVYYGHFWHCGLIASLLAERQKNAVAVTATGESSISVKKYLKTEKQVELLKKIVGVIAVSSKNKDESILLGLASAEKIEIIPNAVDTKIFFKKEMEDLKDELGILEDDFVVISVGSFSNRKGTLRIDAALTKLDDPKIKAIYIGSGEEMPKYHNSVFIGSVEHRKICDYLNCANVFILPTLAEGCCNAIIEAMACGLPIISSNYSFNMDILDGTNSILIDPLNIDEISEAVLRIKNNKKLQEAFSMCSIKKTKELSIQNRAQTILNYIDSL